VNLKPSKGIYWLILINGERLAIIVIYVILSILNYCGFKKIQNLDHDGWHKYEGNFFLSHILKKIGVGATQVLTMVIVIGLVLFFPFSDFWLGFFVGLFSLNLIYDSINFSRILDELTAEKK